MHVLVKKGAVVVAVTEPAKPMLHVQPEGTLVPVEVGEGQATATKKQTPVVLRVIV